MAWYDGPLWQGFLWTPATPGAHSGIDIGCAIGTPLTSLLPGTVVSEGMMPWGGQVNILSTYPGLGPIILSYLHNSRNLKHAGYEVQPGDVIALSGEPPQSGPNAGRYGRGAHVHFEVSRGSQPPYMGHQGPSNPINGQWLIDAARSGTLDAAPSPFAAAGYGTAASIRSGVTHVPGFLPILQQLDAVEQIPPFQWTDPVHSTLAVGGAVTARGVIMLTGWLLILLVVYNLIRNQASEAAQTTAAVMRLGALTGAT